VNWAIWAGDALIVCASEDEDGAPTGADWRYFAIQGVIDAELIGANCGLTL
jgi:hypothetical protein